jgi:hypothetical protein
MNEQTNGQVTSAKDPVEVDQMMLQGYVQEIRDNQNLTFGVIGGIAAAVVGATVWAITTALTNYQIGWMAVGVGCLVGFAVRRFGKGIDTSFGIAGAGLSLLGCLAGNLLTVCIVVSRQQSIALLDVLSRLNPEIAVELMKVTFSPMDLLFYGIAVYEGYRFSFRRISEEELARFAK